MSTDKVYVKELVSLILRYKFSIFAIVIICVALSIQMTMFMEKKFQASFEINIYSKYFKNPLISEIIPGVYNIPEMRFTIDSMVKEAINDDFIDSIGREFSIYSDQELSEKEFAAQRQYLRDRFISYSTGGQSYKITFTYSDPLVAKKVAQKTLEVVKDHFINSRIETIELVKKIMIRRLNAFNASQKITGKGADTALASKSYDVLQAELTKINADIAALSKHFNVGHPKIAKLLTRKKTITRWLEEFEGADHGESSYDSTMALGNTKVVSEALTSSFFTKYHDFNIALDIEKKSLESYIGILQRPQLPTYPTWPKKKLFASIGLILGFVLAFIYVYLREVFSLNNYEHLEKEARELNTVVLGHLPEVTNKGLVTSKKSSTHFSNKPIQRSQLLDGPMH
ncbi:MAG: hypothetical protein QF441_05190 [Bacteriovoracaceae bacterium]|jgi:hypothetical protein|nr:hypothetical protein [Halobacteriovoraceae bacterium]MDP7319979.1 hypothetical protein [Bacteriovoracaceae bacterium]